LHTTHGTAIPSIVSEFVLAGSNLADFAFEIGHFGGERVLDSIAAPPLLIER
jgi:hypothetical protein